MIIISDITDTVWSKSKWQNDRGLNVDLLQAYNLVNSLVKKYFYTGDGISSYEEFPYRLEMLNDFVKKAAAEKIAFFTDDGVVHISETGITVDQSEELPPGFPKKRLQSFEDIKNYFPEEKDFVCIDDQADVLEFAEQAGFKTFLSTSKETPQNLLDHVNEKFGTDFKIEKPTIQNNTPTITEPPKNKSGWWERNVSPLFKKGDQPK